jgi:hypothetical protein
MKDIKTDDKGRKAQIIDVEVCETPSTKKKVIIGRNIKDRIPRCTDTIYKIVATPVCDDDDADKDETLKLHTLRTIEVEGVVVVNHGKAVCVNGEFDISLEVGDDDENEEDILNKTYSIHDEAITAWEYLTKINLERAEKAKEKADSIYNMLKISLQERQY